MPSTNLEGAKLAIRKRKREILVEILVATIALAAALVVHEVSNQWGTALAVALFIEILAVVSRFRILYEPFIARLAEHFDEDAHPFALLSKLSARTIPLELLLDRPSEWVFQEHFDRIIAAFRDALHLLEQGTFTIPLETAQDVSFDVCERLTTSAFCTAPAANLDLFMGPLGERLREANFTAAKRLAAHKGFTRVFIFESFAAITWEYYLLMEENNEHGVEVLVARAADFARILRRHDWEKRGDFGLWDDEYLMTITHTPEERRVLEVSKDSHLLSIGRLVIDELRQGASTWQEFTRQFREPINQEEWATAARGLVVMPPPNGPAESDCNVMCSFVVNELQPRDNIAILGLTSKLIETVSGMMAERPELDLHCDVVDNRSYKESPPRPQLDFRAANWVTWRPADTMYRAILGDDVIPNLGIWQIPLFFRALSEIIVGGGRFVTRTAAMYAPVAMHPLWAESVNRLRLFDPESPTHIANLGLEDLSEGVVYEVAWPTLHSAEFYNKERSSIDFGAWDRRLPSEQGSTDFKAKLRLQYKHKVTALEYGQLQKLARPYFQIVEEHPVYSVWDSDERLAQVPDVEQIVARFREYYKILVFERI